MADAVRVEGLDALVRSFGRVNRKAAGQVRKEMRTGIGGEFVRDVKSRIEGLGLVRSGKLRASIRPAVKGSTLVVRSSPPLRPGRRSAMGYAAIYEYGGRSGAGAFRPYLGPTLDAWRDSGKVETEFNEFLDWVEKEFAA